MARALKRERSLAVEILHLRHGLLLQRQPGLSQSWNEKRRPEGGGV